MHLVLIGVLLQAAAVARAATTFPTNAAVAHVDFSRQTSNIYVVSDRIQYAMMEQDIIAWNSARVRVSVQRAGGAGMKLRIGATSTTNCTLPGPFGGTPHRVAGP